MAETSKTTHLALTVLLEAGRHGPLTVAELSRRLEVNRTVIHRLVATLHDRGFLLRQEDGYVAGAALLEISERVQPDLRLHSRVALQDLAEAVGETVVLEIPDGRDAVVLTQIVPERNIVRIEYGLGARHPLDEGAGGRALLAFLGDEAIDRVARRLADDDRDDLVRGLAAIRDLGYCLSHDELRQGVHGLAVPVLADSGRAFASIAVLAPAARADALTTHLETMTAIAASLARALAAAPRRASS